MLYGSFWGFIRFEQLQELFVQGAGRVNRGYDGPGLFQQFTQQGFEHPFREFGHFIAGDGELIQQDGAELRYRSAVLQRQVIMGADGSEKSMEPAVGKLLNEFPADDDHEAFAGAGEVPAVDLVFPDNEEYGRGYGIPTAVDDVVPLPCCQDNEFEVAVVAVWIGMTDRRFEGSDGQGCAAAGFIFYGERAAHPREGISIAAMFL